MVENVKVQIQKSETPIIWLDTSIINDMVKWKYMTGDIGEAQEKRIPILYANVHKKVREGKLICPLAEQEHEVWRDRDKWFALIDSLSLGIKVRSLQDLQNRQFFEFLDAYVRQKSTINLDWTFFFYNNPYIELKQILRDSLFMKSDTTDLIFGLDWHKNNKKDLNEELNQQRKIHVAKDISFENQLEVEYLGEIDTNILHHEMFLKGEFVNKDDKLNAFFGHQEYCKKIEAWEQLTGKKNDRAGVRNFCASVYHKSIPYVDLSCNLYAAVMTGSKDVKTGDPADISHISSMMPFSNIFITDRAMAHFLKERKFDKKYNTVVCSIKETEVIDEFFSNL